MKILVINAGSSSLKYQLINMNDESVIAKGVVERIGQKTSTLSHSGSKKVEQDGLSCPTHVEAIKIVLDALVSPDCGSIKSVDEITAVGHRVLHGGEKYDSSVVINKDFIKWVEANIDLGPLHMPANIMGIKACQEIMPKAPMVAVFDTTFHATMPAHAYMYAIKYDDYKKYGIRKYGFHGTSHMFIASEVERIYKRKDMKIVICHLGNGSSMSAVVNGKCIDTSMGLTPLEGLVMGTRSGDIDGAVIEYLMQKTGKTIAEATSYLNKECGVLGVSGISSDFRDLLKAMREGDKRAELAVDMFSYRVKKYIGSYIAALGGVDCIAFTGGIGEHTSVVRAKILGGLECFGVEFTEDSNHNNVVFGQVTKISTGKTDVMIIPTNEELVIARETKKYGLGK